MTTSSRIQRLNFASDFIEATVVHHAQNYEVEDAVTVNLSPEPLITGWEVPSTLPGWKSTILKNGRVIRGTRVGLFKVRQAKNLGGVVFRGWEWLGNRISSFPRDTPLYISPQDSVGEVAVDPFVFTNEQGSVKEVAPFEIKLNLWWAPGHTDCFIHNKHPFLEVHTQIFGFGRMQKFREQDEVTIFEDVPMAEGFTHDPFCRVVDKGKVVYPWHRYYADTDCVWLAIELHPKR